MLKSGAVGLVGDDPHRQMEEELSLLVDDKNIAQHGCEWEEQPCILGPFLPR
jgi:hypothetical protein